MNLIKLFHTQKELMDRIEQEHPEQPGEDRFSKRVLALYVEIGECANEVRCFKFWSHKPASAAPIVLEEYVDGLHFILELGVVTSAYIDQEMEFPEGKGDINLHFLQVYDSVNRFFFKPDNRNFISLLENYFYLGAALGFTWEEIEEGYYRKNELNHIRQNNGY